MDEPLKPNHTRGAYLPSTRSYITFRNFITDGQVARAFPSVFIIKRMLCRSTDCPRMGVVSLPNSMDSCKSTRTIPAVHSFFDDGEWIFLRISSSLKRRPISCQ